MMVLPGHYGIHLMVILMKNAYKVAENGTFELCRSRLVTVVPFQQYDVSCHSEIVFR